MKKLMLVLAYTLSVSAHALAAHEFEQMQLEKARGPIRALGMHLTATAVAPSPSAPTPTAPQPPLRTVQLKYNILKHTITKDPATGSYKTDATQVCSSTGVSHLYDFRGASNPTVNLDDNVGKCPSTLNGQNVDIIVAGAEYYLTAPMFSVAPQDYKVASASIFASSTTANTVFSFGYVGSSDLSAKSLIGDAHPLDYICVPGSVGTTCAPTATEYFEAVFEFVD